MSETTALTLGICLGGFLLSALLTKILIVIATRHEVTDVPNQRSSHSHPVPRGGGLSFVIVYLSVLLAVSVMRVDWVKLDVAAALLAGGMLVTIVGLLDDLGDVRPLVRFLVHLAAATVTLLLLPSLPTLPVLGFVVEPHIPLLLCIVVGIVWSINLFNFMDGVDGIAGVEAITMLVCGAFILGAQGNTDWQQSLLLLASCVGGFLIWNWPPAKVFMGDAASGFLGYTLAAIAVASSVDGSVNLWVWLILGGVFFVDATTTLVTRVARGETWYLAHRSHAYQIMSRRFRSHGKVTVAVFLINVVWLFPLAYVAARNPAIAVLMWLVAWIPLLVFAVSVGAGKTGVAEPIS